MKTPKGDDCILGSVVVTRNIQDISAGKYTSDSLPVIPCEDRCLDPQNHPDTPPFMGVQTHTYPPQGGPHEWHGAPWGYNPTDRGYNL